MSNHTNEDTMPQHPAGTDGETPPARKRAAKKAATKTAAVEKSAPAKKAAVKKVAAKKTSAKKVAGKSAASSVPSTPELPFNEPVVSKPVPAPENTEAPRPVKVARPKKIAAEKNEPQPPSPSDESPRRFGRVPGGGPVTPREPAEPREPAPTASIPFPQPQQPPNRESQPPRDQERRERPPQDGQQGQNFQQRDGQGGQGGQNAQGQPRESRSKRRREKRKRRKGERVEQGGHPHQPHRQQHQRHDGGERQAPQNDMDDRRPAQLTGPKIEADGMLELAPKGFGFLRIPGKNFEQARDDVFVTPETIRKYNLRLGQWIHGLYQEGPRGPQLVEISKVNDMTPEEASKLPHFDELKAINPSKRISFETTPERFTTRVVDIMAPVGRGQRGLIVSPPRSGKTTLLLHMAEAIREKYDEGAIHLMVVLVDERPEEVTEFRRALPGAEIYASSNDEQARNHTRIAELAIERAKRLVEAGRDVFLIMDSITRLARAYNGNMNNRGRGTGSGGITIGALEVPRRLFAAARNTRGGGSLTIMATALIQTNSRADEAIYMEFKGTGNMELVLDRKIAENYIYPAVDIFKSGTRREEILLADHMLHKIHLIRRGLSGHRPAEAMERLLFFLKKFPNNPQMLLEIKG
ncbi:MAG: transcription termination factor Rho [Verrucomicrobiota bacterium]